MRTMRIIGLLAFFAICGAASAQSPGMVYTWNGTNDLRGWSITSATNPATLANTVAGELTITEQSSEFGDTGGEVFFADNGDRVRESSATASGGLDLLGLTSLEFDVSRNGTGNVTAQFYVKAGRNSDFLSFPATTYSIGPGDHTLTFPLSLLTPDQRTYMRQVGIKVFDHPASGNLTWTLKEVRSTGTPLTHRDIATHDTGSSENGFNGVFLNFEQSSVVGNDGGQNQTGLTQISTGPGTLQWTDKGGSQGAAIAWGNGTEFGGTTFYERPTDISNYTHVTFRVSATDAANPTGVIGFQGYVQTPNKYQALGNIALPTDGQFHDLTFPISSLTDRQFVNTTGFNLLAHATDVIINVDRVSYDVIHVAGDYNENGIVDAADYNVWRDKLGNNIALPNEGASPGVVDQADYDFWKSHFNNSSGSGSDGNSSAVPEPSTVMLACLALLAGLRPRRRTA